MSMYVYHRLTHGVEKLAESDKLIIMYNVYVDSKKKRRNICMEILMGPQD